MGPNVLESPVGAGCPLNMPQSLGIRNWRNSSLIQIHSRFTTRLIFNSPPRSSFSIKTGTPLVRGRISTGRHGFDTPAGRYLVTDKERTRFSSLYKVPMPYFLRLSFSEYGIHEGYVPGRPASHGCIR